MGKEAVQDIKLKPVVEASQIVERLMPVISALRDNEAEFVRSMNEKFKRYGADTYVSYAQLDWLKILDAKHAPDPRQAALF